MFARKHSRGLESYSSLVTRMPFEATGDFVNGHHEPHLAECHRFFTDFHHAMGFRYTKRTYRRTVRTARAKAR